MKANEALYSTHGKTYEIRQIPYFLYTASGGSADWALGEAKIPYEYSIELGDMGALGFILPPTEIIPTCEEMMVFHVLVAHPIIEEFSA